MKLRQLSDRELIATVTKRIVGPCPSRAAWPEHSVKLATLTNQLTYQLADNRIKFLRDYKPWMYGIAMEV